MSCSRKHRRPPLRIPPARIAVRKQTVLFKNLKIEGCNAPKSTEPGGSKGNGVSRGSVTFPLGRFFRIFLAGTRKIPAGGTGTSKDEMQKNISLRVLVRVICGESPQKNCPGYSQDSEDVIIIGEAIAPPQLSLYKRRIFVYNRASCNETYYSYIV